MSDKRSVRLHLGPLLLLLVAAAARADDLAASLAAKLAASKGTTFTVLVVDEASGETLFAHAPDTALVPASNMKVLTTAAALARLGPAFQHETRLMGPGPVGPDGVLKGDLVVVGEGDPTISRRFGPEPLLADWAEAVWRAGVRRVTGDVVADDRAFDDVRLHPDWEESDAERWYGAEVGALSLNDNCIDVSVAGSAQGAVVTLEPATAYVAIDLAAGLTDQKKQHVFSILRVGEDKRTLRVTGKIWPRAAAQESSIPIRDPGLFFATVLRERLVARGIAVEGGARRARDGDRPGGFTFLRRQAPLLPTLTVTNQRSQNFYAECLTKTLGRKATGGPGTWPAGAEAIAAHARAAGADADEVKVRDGSGLSRENRLSAAALVAVLRAAGRGSTAAQFRDTFAAPGQEGTLERRLADLPKGATLRAKTGTLRGVAALSGWVTVGERRAVFAAIGNGGGGGRDAIDEVIRAVARQLAR